eukprot:CAMPEP_0118911372 /NCGR_PEP_ID=MMETSP1166-20130328/13096_1 /TAXON_ID=1104430 /ORGANISM="Chrysoreinhardia sp, Strain CCMP3193" /LENGTH=171 /DNA_ID=CAMNT_0006850855 /DNA_START=9 /DNA_END=521 /DNA_ORIENTATION=-
MTPAVFEMEVSHRSLPQLAEHGGLLFQNWPDLGVFEGFVAYPRQKVSGDATRGPFPAFYFQVVRNWDDDPTTFRVEQLLSIGTEKHGLQDKTLESVIEQWRKFGVTTVRGVPLDDFEKDPRSVVTELTSEQRKALKDAVAKFKPDAPAAVRDVLQFDIPNTSLYGPGNFRK